MLLKIPSLPHAALQHLCLYATSSLIESLSNDSSPSIRNAAVEATAAFVLRHLPPTAPSIETVRLEQLDQQQLSVVRNAIERLLFALLQALFDPSDHVATNALKCLTRYALEAWTDAPSLLNATRRATATTIWDHLKKSADDGASANVRLAKEVLKGLSRLVSYVLDPNTSLSNDENQSVAQSHQVASKWGIYFADHVIVPLCDDVSAELSSCACTSLLVICSYAKENPTAEKVASWGIKATRRITRILIENDAKLPLVVMAGLMRDGSNALAALSKNDYVNSKFISAISVGLLPFAAKCPTKSVRLEAFSVISSAIVEYDLSGRDAGVGVAMKALLTSDSWRGVVDSGDSSVASELMYCMSQSLLDASRKIF
ncbi:hypothetical protein FGB62_242g05 [Gracilaria domingensis]|nr:hypothetical protein FGB62_242g05 [Gracilaria domingensis]